MVHPLEEDTITCPYCGEPLTLLVDCSVAEQDYIEDCEVCCCPIQIHSQVTDEGQLQLTAHTENE